MNPQDTAPKTIEGDLREILEILKLQNTGNTLGDNGEYKNTAITELAHQWKVANELLQKGKGETNVGIKTRVAAEAHLNSLKGMITRSTYTNTEGQDVKLSNTQLEELTDKVSGVMDRYYPDLFKSIGEAAKGATQSTPTEQNASAESATPAHSATKEEKAKTIEGDLSKILERLKFQNAGNTLGDNGEYKNTAITELAHQWKVANELLQKGKGETNVGIKTRVAAEAHLNSLKDMIKHSTYTNKEGQDVKVSKTRAKMLADEVVVVMDRYYPDLFKSIGEAAKGATQSTPTEQNASAESATPAHSATKPTAERAPPPPPAAKPKPTPPPPPSSKPTTPTQQSQPSEKDLFNTCFNLGKHLDSNIKHPTQGTGVSQRQEYLKTIINLLDRGAPVESARECVEGFIKSFQGEKNTSREVDVLRSVIQIIDTSPQGVIASARRIGRKINEPRDPQKHGTPTNQQHKEGRTL